MCVCVCLLAVIKSKLSTTATLGTEKSGRYGAILVGVKIDTDIFSGFSIFIFKKMLTVTCKYVTQSKYNI